MSRKGAALLAVLPLVLASCTGGDVGSRPRVASIGIPPQEVWSGPAWVNRVAYAPGGQLLVEFAVEVEMADVRRWWIGEVVDGRLVASKLQPLGGLERLPWESVHRSPTNEIAAFSAPGSRDPLDPADLYVIAADGLSSRQVLGPVEAPRGPAWSHDGSWLAFSGRLEGLGSGTWALHVATGTLVHVSEVGLCHVAWSPDGRWLAGTRQTCLDPADRRLLRIDVGGIGEALPPAG